MTPDASTRLRRTAIGHWVLVGLVLTVAAILRVRQLDLRGFWLDECYSAEISAGHGFGHMELPEGQRILGPDLQGLGPAAKPWWRVWTSQGRDNSPPLYFLVLRAWREGVGSSDRAMRSLSVILSLVAVGLVYGTARTLWGDGGTALWAAALMSLATVQLEYARQARPYALLTAFACAALFAAARLDRFGWSKRRSAALAVASYAAVATHWQAIGFTAALGGFALVRWRGALRWRALAALAVAGVVAAVTLGPLLVHQVREASYMTWWVRDRDPHGHAMRVFSAMTSLPARFFGIPYGMAWANLGWTAMCALPALLIWRGGRRDLWLPALTLYGAALLPVAADIVRGTVATWQTRYVILAHPPMCLAIAGMFRSTDADPAWRRRLLGIARHFLPASVALLSVASLASFYAEPLNEDWKRMLRPAVAAFSADPTTPVVFATSDPSDPEARPGTLYLCASRYVPVAGRAVFFTQRPMSDGDLRSLASPRRVWLLTGWSRLEPTDVVPHSRVIERHWYYPTGYAALLAVAPPPTSEP